MGRKKVNPIEPTQKINLKTRKEEQEEFLKELKVARKKHQELENGTDEQQEKRYRDAKNTKLEDIKEEMEKKNQAQIYRLKAMLEENSIEDSIRILGKSANKRKNSNVEKEK